MLGHRDMTMQDYADIFKRRVWLILACTVLILGISVGVSYMLPPQYMSQTLVLIEQQKVPENYVKPVVNEDLNARLASMREQILQSSRCPYCPAGMRRDYVALCQRESERTRRVC